MSNPRQLAFIALRSVRQGAFADAALDRVLQVGDLSHDDRRLVTELVYGTVRRMRSLDATLDRLGKKKAHQQPPDLRTILHLGLYQLQYLDRIPPSAAVNSTVQLAKENGFPGLAGFVNALLRQYLRQGEDDTHQNLVAHPSVENLGMAYSFPDWIIATWLEQLGVAETEALCQWMNTSPAIDLRINPLQTSLEEVETAMQSAGVTVSRLPHLPHALRLSDRRSDLDKDEDQSPNNPKPQIQRLPGYDAGWWTVQDASAQLAGYLLDPQPGEVIIDACAAPGGKTTHIAELMGDKGKIWACDRAASRMKKLQENIARLDLKSIQISTGDSRDLPNFIQASDRVLLDAPCSGLGTLHRRADARWRHQPETIEELATLQKELLEQAATWVKPGGILVYATCTIHPQENEGVIQPFLAHHPDWQIAPPSPNSPASHFTTPEGWIKVWPHRDRMDGFFMIRLARNLNS
jgi:16S rRNA (cytosine967-C5)-methyltransferase